MTLNKIIVSKLLLSVTGNFNFTKQIYSTQKEILKYCNDEFKMKKCCNCYKLDMNMDNTKGLK
jgi:hypothetical protein